MDAFNALLGGFATALTPWNLMWRLIGTTLGTAFFVLTGIETIAEQRVMTNP